MSIIYVWELLRPPSSEQEEDCDIEQAGNPFMIDEFPSLEWSWGMKVKSQLIFANAYIV